MDILLGRQNIFIDRLHVCIFKPLFGCRAWVLSTLNPGWKFLLPYLQKLCKILTQEWIKMRQKEPIFALNKIAGWHKNAGLAPQETGKIMLSDKKSTTTGKNISALLLHFLLKGVKPFSFLGCQCFCVAQHLGIRQKRNFCITFASETCKNLKKWKFGLVFGVGSTQMLVKIYNRYKFYFLTP